MGLNIDDLDARLSRAVQGFWQSLASAVEAKGSSDKSDVGKRGAVTSGKHLDSLIGLIGEVVRDNGLEEASVLTKKSLLTLPGYFRATKNWDLLIVHESTLVAAVELKSMGSSFGNNLNNRVEEVLGQSLDFNKAFEGLVFGECPKPFVGYCVLLADHPDIYKGKSNKSLHFPVLPEFKDASYAERFNILCKKMVKEELYSEAALILSCPKKGLDYGENHALDDSTSFKRFITGLAAHVARIAALKYS